ncbi:putative RNA-binding protein [Metarhizium anisopliae]
MFIGGLNWETTDQSLREYFEQFGEVVECTVMRDSTTGRSRGFGFLTFKDAKTVNIVMVKEHFLDGKIIDPKRAIPRDEQEKTSKIFVGGVSQETTDQEFRDYFAQFGRVVDATLMMDKDTGRPRGFGFVTFESEAGVEACINVPLEIHGKPVEVKRAQPRGNLREEEEAAKRSKFKKDDQSGGQGMGQQMGNSGITPQVMAQYFQRMQQYFAMFTGQMAMNRGMNMNPAMRGGRGGGYGMGGGRGGGGGGGPTSWEGMYDDVPQPDAGGYRRGGHGSSDGGHGGAAPLNAPTGPKNAGRPGANYRGGGRGGSRGYHPYAR